MSTSGWRKLNYRKNLFLYVEFSGALKENSILLYEKCVNFKRSVIRTNLTLSERNVLWYKYYISIILPDIKIPLTLRLIAGEF